MEILRLVGAVAGMMNFYQPCSIAESVGPCHLDIQGISALP